MNLLNTFYMSPPSHHVNVQGNIGFMQSAFYGPVWPWKPEFIPSGHKGFFDEFERYTCDE